MTAAFRTRDGLIAIAECPQVDGDTPSILRFIPGKAPEGNWRDWARRYNRTTETVLGWPLYEEAA